LKAEYRRATEAAAKQYGRLGVLLYALGRSSPTRKQQASIATGKAARCWFNLGEYAKAARLYDDLARRSDDPTGRVEALGGTVACHAALGQTSDARRKLTLLRKEVPRLPAPERGDWERWLADADRELEK
jgi:hypothetical protein